MARPRKPTAIHELQGTYKPGRHGDRTTTRASSRQVQCPDHLAGLARWAWMHFAPLVRETRVLTVADTVALERLCCIYAEVRAYDLALADGTTYQPESLDRLGNPVKGMMRMRPEVAARADADRRLTRMLTEFGLTPAARAKAAQVEPTDDVDDPVDQYFDA